MVGGLLGGFGAVFGSGVCDGTQLDIALGNLLDPQAKLFGSGVRNTHILVTATANSAPCLLTNYNGNIDLDDSCGKVQRHHGHSRRANHDQVISPYVERRKPQSYLR